MNVISRSTIREFIEKDNRCEQQLNSWYHLAILADWKKPQDVKSKFSSASFLPGNIVVFNVKGNSYRLVTRIAYNCGSVYIQFIGTHAEYNKKKFG